MALSTCALGPSPFPGHIARLGRFPSWSRERPINDDHPIRGRALSAAVALQIHGEPISIRDAQASDVGYIRATWLTTYKASARIPPEVYDANQPKLVTKILQSPDTRAMVAYSPDIPDSIHGWVVAGPTYLHYAFVPFPLRGQGIARELVTEVLGHYSARIDVTHRFFNRQPQRKRFVFNPYRLGALL